jgi:D-aminoacyl-tRNA deacylase
VFVLDHGVIICSGAVNSYRIIPIFLSEITGFQVGVFLPLAIAPGGQAGGNDPGHTSDGFMIALIQRVTEASVSIDGQVTASINGGMLALIGVEKTDSPESASQLAQKLLTYRLFSDQDGKMNLDVQMAGGQLLLVPQFTLVADTQKGRRPGFSRAAAPGDASALFDHLVKLLSAHTVPVAQGTFGADMKVSLVNDGPVTFWLQVPSVSPS